MQDDDRREHIWGIVGTVSLLLLNGGYVWLKRRGQVKPKPPEPPGR